MKKTVLAAVAATGLAITGASSVALAAGDDDRGGRTPAAVADATPSAFPTADDNGGQREGFGDSSTPAPTATADSTAGARLSRAQASAQALLRAGGGRVTKTEQEWEDGRLIWKIEVFIGSVEYDIRVDSRTGEIVRFRSRDRGDDDRGRGRGGDDRSDHDGSGHRGRGSDDGPGDDNGGDRGGRGRGSDDD